MSVDASVLNSHYVFAGKIVQVLEGTRRSAGANVEVAVDTRLKGQVSEVVGTVIRVPDADLKRWKEGGNRLLIMHEQTPIDLSDPDLKVLTYDIKVLTKGQQVVDAARAAIRRHKGVYGMDTFSRQIPLNLIKKHSLEYQRVIVPADETLERWAIGALRSSAPYDRAEAADALGRFYSEENARRLKGLLNDPGVVPTQNGPNGRVSQLFLVRMRAYAALEAMGITVPKPIFYREPDAP